MRTRLLSALPILAIAIALAAVIAGPASATPSKTTACTSCHSGAASGTVTAVPSTATPAAGASYTVAITNGLASSGNTGYHIAQTDAGGTTTTWVAVYGGGVGSTQTSYTATMTAPVAAGTYYYNVWCVKGPASSAGQAKAATYSITVPAPPAGGASLTSLSRRRAAPWGPRSPSRAPAWVRRARSPSVASPRPPAPGAPPRSPARCPPVWPSAPRTSW